ncbi:MAG: class D beta-lactamase [Ignavibacteriales bacterium]|nr:class D beta-lactamase [Ignavibacteriales bacterium]
MKQNLSFLIVFLIASSSIFSQKIEERKDFKKYFDEYGHDGCFVLYDLKKNTFLKYNPTRCGERFIPASTFKIFNSLVGLETGAVKDQFEVFKWDSVKRFYDMWNQDIDMVNAFKYSAVWFYQELARKIGEEKMQHYISLNHYGNENISGGIDRFWLDGGLRISADEQIEMLKKLYHNKLKFSQRTMDIVKDIMFYDKTDDYIIRAKTGWAIRVEDQIGWFVGYVEKGSDVFFFAINVESKKPEEGFTSRKEITFKILKELKIL